MSRLSGCVGARRAAPDADAPPASPGAAQRRTGGPGSRARVDLPPWQRVKAALQLDPFDYLKGLGRLSPNARPSSLQPLLKRRQHTLSSLCTPHLDSSGLHFADLHTEGPSGKLAPLEGVAQCSLVLGTVTGVPGSGLQERKCWLNVARMCLYDGAKFHGSVQAIKPREVRAGKGGDTWAFDAAPLLVRCPRAALHRMCVYLEFNVSYELTPEDLARLPAKPGRAARQVDEICVAWALVELRALLQPQGGVPAGKTLSVPLRGGPLAQRLPLRRAMASAGQATQHPKKSVFGGSLEPSASVRLAPASPDEAAAAEALPAAAIASPAVARVVGLYRMLLAEGLAEGRSEGCASAQGVSHLPDLALAALPAILDDPDISHAFFQLWEQQTAPRVAPTTSELKGVLRQCAALVWMMMGAQAIPAASIANHASHQWERKKRMDAYLCQHPAAALNAAAQQWFHAPFNAAELACDPLRCYGLTA